MSRTTLGPRRLAELRGPHWLLSVRAVGGRLEASVLGPQSWSGARRDARVGRFTLDLDPLDVADAPPGGLALAITGSLYRRLCELYAVGGVTSVGGTMYDADPRVAERPGAPDGATGRELQNVCLPGALAWGCTPRQ